MTEKTSALADLPQLSIVRQHSAYLEIREEFYGLFYDAFYVQEKQPGSIAGNFAKMLNEIYANVVAILADPGIMARMSLKDLARLRTRLDEANAVIQTATISDKC